MDYLLGTYLGNIGWFLVEKKQFKMDKFISTFKTKVINRQFGYFLLTSDDRMLAYCMMVAEVMVDDY